MEDTNPYDMGITTPTHDVRITTANRTYKHQ